MAVSEKGMYHVKYVMKSNPGVPLGVLVEADSYDEARDIFKESGTEFLRITSISEVAANFLMAGSPKEIKVKLVDKTDPEIELKKNKGKDK